MSTVVFGIWQLVVGIMRLDEIRTYNTKQFSEL